MSKMKRAISVEELQSRTDPTPEVRLLRSQVAQLRSRVDELKIIVGKNENLFAELAEAIHEIKPQPFVYVPPKDTTVASPISEVWHLTDWHIGEIIEADEVEFFNAYNYDIAKARVGLFTKTCLRWTELLRHTYRVEELVILCTGDFISGDIHDELKITNEFPSPVQCVKAGTLLAEAIAAAAPHFPKIRVEFVVPDNHSRLTKKPQAKQSGLNSFNYIVGWVAKEMLAAHTNIHFELYPHHQQVVAINGMRYLCQHGHGIKGTWGIPYYGVERVTSQAAKARMNAPDKRKFDRLLIGHFHSPLRSQFWCIGGSLTGTSEYDHQNNRYCKPCQTAWVVHPRHGEFNYMEIWLDNLESKGF